MFSPKLISILAVGGALVGAAPAAADNVAYTGSDGNVWISASDGARKKQITTNGTAADPYQRPSQTDDGKILTSRQRIFYLHNQDGTVRWTWVAPTAPSLYYNPLGHHISPDSGTIVWWFVKSDGIYDPPQQWLAFHDGNGTSTSRCLYSRESGLHDPRWLPGQPYAGGITTDGREVRIQRQGYSDPVGWCRRTTRPRAGARSRPST